MERRSLLNQNLATEAPYQNTPISSVMGGLKSQSRHNSSVQDKDGSRHLGGKKSSMDVSDRSKDRAASSDA